MWDAVGGKWLLQLMQMYLWSMQETSGFSVRLNTVMLEFFSKTWVLILHRWVNQALHQTWVPETFLAVAANLCPVFPLRVL